ncbi:hypothetical protein MYX88_000716 [Salmonella enterica]|uniref:hypothetical protein n=1 Tax=Escherichia coli TaxID=562 RepID=UPI00126DFEFC|nr:hypothetical protein [Salmonella enterica subsp. enterica serovar Enteritidis]EFQ8878920.1 hypothetical protein [Salmonella enterica]EJC3635718.1 hypothetical protein [Salmonella enterica]HAF5272905.1 hypothetical protein [Salmonella enterica]
MDTSGFDIQFDNHIPENGYRIEGYLCNANNAKECQAIMVRSEPFHQIDYSAMGNCWTLGFGSVLLLWLFSVGVGQVIKMVRTA